jgi:hypothetical protein
MTDYELVESILQREFPELVRARSIVNPLADFSWIEALAEPERSQEWLRWRTMLDAIQAREEELRGLDDRQFLLLRQNYGVDPQPEVRRKKKKGRPHNKFDPATSAQDEIIGRTAQWMVVWGFPYRAVCKSISKCLPSILGFTDLRESSITSYRVEQIYEAWRSQSAAQRKRRVGIDWHFQRSRYTTESLRRSCPNQCLDLHELVKALLTNGGNWPPEWGGGDGFHVGELDLNPKPLTTMKRIPKLAKRKRGS